MEKAEVRKNEFNNKNQKVVAIFLNQGLCFSAKSPQKAFLLSGVCFISELCSSFWKYTTFFQLPNRGGSFPAQKTGFCFYFFDEELCVRVRKTKRALLVPANCRAEKEIWFEFWKGNLNALSGSCFPGKNQILIFGNLLSEANAVHLNKKMQNCFPSTIRNKKLLYYNI